MTNVYQAPEANLVSDKVATGNYGSVEKAISGDYEFSIGSVLSEAWEKTSGAKWPIILAFLYYFLMTIGLAIGIGIVTAGVNAVSADSSIQVVVQIVAQLALMLVITPMIMGIVIMGIKRSVDAPISASSVFGYFSKMLPLFGTMLLINIMIMIGFILLVIPGIYLMVAYYMAIPLVAEKGLSPWKAMEVSRKAITHRWFAVFILFIVMAIIMAISMIPAFIGMIWTIPMMMIAYGILYRNMFGVESDTVA